MSAEVVCANLANTVARTQFASALITGLQLR